MSIKSSVVVAGLLVGAATAASAEKFDVYDCTFKVSRGDLTAENVTLFISQETKQAYAIDGFIHYEHGEPIKVASSVTDKKIVAKWRTRVYSSNGRSAPVEYRLSYQPGIKRASFSANAVKYTNVDSVHGTCKHTVENLSG